VAGALSLAKVSDLRNRCPSDRCAPGAQPDIDSAKTLGWVSTIGFAVGGAGVATGAVLLFLRHPSEEAATGRQRPAIAPFVGWASAGVEGKF
jgi:hypothetical protein